MSNNDPDVIIDKCEHYDGSFDEEDEEEHEERREEEEYYDDEEYYEDNTDTSKQETVGKAKRRLADRKRFRACVVSLLVLILVLVLGAIAVIALWVTGVVGGGASVPCPTEETTTPIPTTAAPTPTLTQGNLSTKKLMSKYQR